MVELEYYSNLFKIISTIYMKEMEQLELKAKIILIGISLLIMTFLFTPQLIYAADENPDRVVETITKTWINPYYPESISQPQFFTPQEAGEPVSVSNLDDLTKTIHSSYNNRETSKQITYTGSSSDLSQLEDIIKLVLIEDEYLYSSITKWGFSAGGYEGEVIINLTATYLTTLEQENDIDTTVKKILSTIISPGMSPHQIVKAIHDYIVLNVTYDTSATPAHSAYAALYGEKKTVCQGYSLLAYKMLKEAELQTRIILGDAGGPHAWNMVKIDDNWYCLDCTWDDPDDTSKVFYNYYNLNNEEISIDHDPYIEGEENSLKDYQILMLEADTSYYETLNTLIDANTEQSDIYLRLRQQLLLDYLLLEKTPENETVLRTIIQTNISNHNSTCSIRYYIGSTDPSAALNRVGEIIREISPYVGYGLSASYYTRGGLTGYIIVNMEFTYSSPNDAPTASPVEIAGKLQPGETVRAIYNYSDTEDNKQGLSQFEWYRGVSVNGSDKTLIPGAIGSVYRVQSIDVGKYLFFRVCPVAITGTLSGDWSGLSIASAQVKLASTALTAGQVTVTNNPVGTPDVINITGLQSGDIIRVYSSLTAVTPLVNGAVPAGQTALQLSAEQLGTEAGVLYISVQNTDKNESVRTAVSYTAEAGTDECFIATAAFGSKFTWPVALLRHFRDQYLLTNDIGKAFVNFYYRHSPPIAAVIADSQLLRIMVRLLLAPIIAIVFMVYHPVVLAAVMGLLFVFLLFRVRRRYV